MILKANPQASESQIAWKQLRLNDSARTFLHFVCEPGSIVPVFVKESKVGSSRQLVGFYDTDHLEKLSQDVQQYSGQATGIFYGLNPVNRSCLARASNCLQSRKLPSVLVGGRRRILKHQLDAFLQLGDVAVAKHDDSRSKAAERTLSSFGFRNQTDKSGQ